MDEPTKSLPLVFEAPRRGKPPQHLADLDEAERKAAVEAAGLPGFRAKQVSNHYFARLVDSAEEMTDLPAQSREALVQALLPKLLDPRRVQSADKGRSAEPDLVPSTRRRHGVAVDRRQLPELRGYYPEELCDVDLLADTQADAACAANCQSLCPRQLPTSCAFRSPLAATACPAR